MSVGYIDTSAKLQGGEGGVSELGHMVFTLIATRNGAESRRAHAWTGAPGASEHCTFDRRWSRSLRRRRLGRFSGCFRGKVHLRRAACKAERSV